VFEPLIGKGIEVYINDMIVKSTVDTVYSMGLQETFYVLYIYGLILNPNKCIFRVRSNKYLGFMISSWGIEGNSDKEQVVLNMKPLRNVKEVKWLTSASSHWDVSCPSRPISVSPSSGSLVSMSTFNGTTRLSR